jgi:hypothetical protein
MTKLMVWLRSMSDTWKGIIALGTALFAGIAIATTISNFRALPQALRALEQTVTLNTERLDRLEEVFEMQTCLQIADRDPMVHWEECISLYPEVGRWLRRWRQGEDSWN